MQIRVHIFDIQDRTRRRRRQKRRGTSRTGTGGRRAKPQERGSILVAADTDIDSESLAPRSPPMNLNEDVSLGIGQAPDREWEVSSKRK